VYAYPNPFKKSTRFMWGSTGRADVVIKIYTQSGKLIKVLKSRDVMGSTAPGADCVWDGCDEAGNPVGRGVYFYKMIFNLPETGKEEETEEEKTVEEAPVIGKLMKL
jgi:flagellar hook assembly protein FlgD